MKIILIILLPLSVLGQSFKQYLPSIAMTFGAGLTDGLRDASLFRMDGYSKFWNGKQSMDNKYKNGDINQGAAYFGSTTFLVWTTDGAHLANMFTHQFQGMALAYAPYDENKKFFHVFLKVAVYNVVRQIGHSLVYDMIYKPRQAQ